MRNTFTLTLLFLIIGNIQAQVNYNLTKLGQFDYPQACNDIWGYVDENGDEYAIMGTRTGTSIIALDRADSLEEIFFIPGVSSTWRDIKHYGDHLYVTTDVGQEGLLIIDMSQVSSDSISYHFWRPELELNGNNLDTLNKCHNIYADDNGYAYLAGCNIYSGGVLIFNLIDNPDTPQLVGASDRIYAHDCYVNNDVLYTSDIYAGEVSIYDVRDKSNPQLLGRQSTTGNFTHNAWSSYDNNYVFTTDEIRGGYVDAYDISDPNDIKRLDSWQPRDAFDRAIIPHNTHFFNDFLITSWYTEGVIVLDASQPDNLIPVAQYDTYDGSQGGFEGAWGAYPFLPSGRILVSDINSGLFVFEPDYVRAARLEGIITDTITGERLSNVTVKIHDTLETEVLNDGNGFYKTGTAMFGELVVSYTKSKYKTHYDTLIFEEGQNLINDVQLSPDFNIYSWNLTILDSATSEALDAVQVKLTGTDDIAYVRTTNTQGQLQQPLVPEGMFTINIGKWGHREVVLDSFNITGDRSDTVYLSKGYQDYFNLDLDWKTSGTASSGFWVRDIPAMTEFEGRISNPGQDSQDDIGDFAYVTGNINTGGAGFDDIDAGEVVLSSPWMDLSRYNSTEISFDYWFFTDGGDTDPDDTMDVHIISPDQVVNVVNFGNSRSEWTKFSFALDSFWTSELDSIRIVFTASDRGNGHIVEAGIDAFKVTGEMFTTFTQNPTLHQVSVYPNPTSEFLNLSGELIDIHEKYSFRIISMDGKIVQTGQLSSVNIYVGGLAEGTYVLDLISGDKKYFAQFTVH